MILIKFHLYIVPHHQRINLNTHFLSHEFKHLITKVIDLQSSIVIKWGLLNVYDAKFPWWILFEHLERN